MLKQLTMGLLGAALAAGVILIRSQKEEPEHPTKAIPAGESVPGQFHPDKLRELGI